MSDVLKAPFSRTLATDREGVLRCAVAFAAVILPGGLLVLAAIWLWRQARAGALTRAHVMHALGAIPWFASRRRASERL